MSFLQLLYDDCEITDSQCVCAADEVETSALWSDSVTDSECAAELDCVETDVLFEDGIANLQLCKHVEDAEVQMQFNDVSSSQLLQDVQLIESSLNNILEGNIPQSAPQNLSRYQSPAIPLPTFPNTEVILPKSFQLNAVPAEKPSFDLGFGLLKDNVSVDLLMKSHSGNCEKPPKS